MNSLCTVVLIMLFTVSPRLSLQEGGKANYDELLAQMKRGEPSFDFTSLRMAYADSPNYSPNSGDRRALEEPMAKRDSAAVIAVAEKQLEQNYLNVWAHWALWQVFTEAKETQRAEFHQYVLRGMLNSIASSGDGKSASTAFHVISNDETYFVLTALGIQMKSQALQTQDGHSYDVMTGTDRQSGREVTLYFNIDRSMKYLQRILQPNPEEKPAPQN